MNGYINEDIFSYDVKRFEKFHSNIDFIKERITETLGDLYGMHWPHKQHKTSRNIKTLPYHHDLVKLGACFGVSGGYERPMWFSINGEKPKYKYSYNYQNWFPSAEFETKNCRENVGLFEMSPFSKFELNDKNAHDEIQKLCTANIKNEPGKCTYTQMLNPQGGIEADLTVICLEKDYFRIVSSAATREKDKFHIKKYINKQIILNDVTDEYCVFGLFGPKSRDLMSKISNDDFSKENFKFGTGKYVKIENINIWAQRLSYVGELGFELYVKKQNATDIYNKLSNLGKEFKLSNCGAHAMDIMRMESGFLHWGHDISPEENQYEAGLQFTISYKKNVNFIGKQALLNIKNKKIKKNFAMFTLDVNLPGKPLLLHDEPIYLGNSIIGRTTSGNHSFCFNKNLSFGYINSGNKPEDLINKDIFIEVEKQKFSAKILKNPLKDKNFKLI